MKISFIFFVQTISIFTCYSQSELVDNANSFALTIYHATKPDSANFFISPLGLNIALAIATEGARADTRDELDRLLGVNKSYPNRADSYDELLLKTKNLDDSLFRMSISFYGNRSGKNELYLSNSIWINDTITTNSDYEGTIRQSYHSDIFQFKSKNIQYVNKKIDDWASRSTNNKIQHITGLKPEAMLGIFNVIYFMGEWEMPFDRKETRAKNFRTLANDKIKVDYLRKQSMYKYYEDKDVQAVYLPYRHEQFSMLVLLPRKTNGILALENAITKDYLQRINSSAISSEVILSLPKFKIETEISPVDDLIRLGYTKMFSDNASFAGISSSSPLKISEIIQKTFIQIDEKKTEAAAVTKVEMVMVGYGGGEPSAPPRPKIFTADHPFIFFIIDKRTNAILFSGRFVRE